MPPIATLLVKSATLNRSFFLELGWAEAPCVKDALTVSPSRTQAYIWRLYACGVFPAMPSQQQIQRMGWGTLKRIYQRAPRFLMGAGAGRLAPDIEKLRGIPTTVPDENALQTRSLRQRKIGCIFMEDVRHKG